MKNLIFTAILAMALCSCSALSNLGQKSSTPAANAQTTTTNAQQMGKNAGTALDALYAQYKQDGKIDFTNFTNLANILNLMGAAQDLKANKGVSGYKTDFAKGLVLGSMHIDTEATANNVTNTLTNLSEQVDTSKLQAAASKGQATAAEIQTVSNSLQNIFNLFK